MPLVSRQKAAKGLSGKRALFVSEYLKDRNATQAAIRAGYSERSAYAQGSALLKNHEVSEAVAAGAKRIADKAEVRAVDVLAILRDIALSASEDTHNRIKACELLGKNEKLWTDKVEVSADSSFAEALKLARDRARR